MLDLFKSFEILYHEWSNSRQAVIQVQANIGGVEHQGWRNDSRGGGTRPWGPRGKRSVSVSKGPKPPIQLLQLLKNSPREAKRVHFRYILVPPGSHPGNEINGAWRGRSLPVPPVSPAMYSTLKLLGVSLLKVVLRSLREDIVLLAAS